ncbi:hypothetical protein [Megalodesulfovibrio paquesii]
MLYRIKENSPVLQDAFGRFLLDKGIIAPDTLANAQAHLLQHNQRVGELAVQQELLTKEQVSALLERQKRSSKFIGELAVEEGLLTRDDLDDLLFSQTVHSFSLGEVLLEEGAISPESFAEAMQEFLWLEEEKNRVVWDVLDGLPERDIMPAVAQSLELALLRFTGQRVKAECLCTISQGGRQGSCWAICLLLRGAEWLECALFLSPALMARVHASQMLHPTIAEASGDTPGSPSVAAPASGPVSALDGTRPFMEIVARYLSEALSACGIPVETWKVVACGEEQLASRAATCLTLTTDASSSHTGAVCSPPETEQDQHRGRLKVFVTLSCPQCPCP